MSKPFSEATNVSSGAGNVRPPRLGPVSKPLVYLGALDGVRFLAFVFVFIHHATPFGPIGSALNAKGFVGVEIFFVISSFLFFYLLNLEWEANGRISFPNFYIRRVLRIYPLLIIYVVSMFLLYGSSDVTMGILRLYGIITSTDNILTWFYGYNFDMLFSAHLWTLSFEMQIYLLIPFLFLLWKRLGVHRFVILLGILYAMSVAARLFYQNSGVPHPSIWVTPALRPESIFLGILLAAFRPRWKWFYSAIASAGAFMAFFVLPSPWIDLTGSFLSYPLMGIAGVTLVDVAMRGPPRKFFELLPIRWLGRISYGLYVFHFVGIQIVGPHMFPGFYDPALISTDFLQFSKYLLASFVGTLSLSVVSYILLERPVDRFKKRFSTVIGRA